MKITRAGTFVWTPADGPVLVGWALDMEGAPPGNERELLALVMNHIALTTGLSAAAVAPDPERAMRDVEDAIERARKAGL